MARVLSGVYSRPSNKAGGIVWGAGRTRYGKVATAREWVIPTDPQTADQLEQRSVFSTAVAIAGLMTGSLYQDAWDNTLGLLPGWQSLVSYLTSALGYDTPYNQFLEPPPDKTLGPGYMPEMTLDTGAGAAGSIELNWTDEAPGDHAAAADTLWGALIQKTHPGVGGYANFTLLAPGPARSTATKAWTGLLTDWPYQFIGWFRHTEADLSYTYSPLTVPYGTSHS